MSIVQKILEFSFIKSKFVVVLIVLLTLVVLTLIFIRPQDWTLLRKEQYERNTYIVVLDTNDEVIISTTLKEDVESKYVNKKELGVSYSSKSVDYRYDINGNISSTIYVQTFTTTKWQEGDMYD